MSATTTTAPSRKGLSAALWTAQVLLAVLFGLAGVMKTFLPIDALLGYGINYAAELPYWLLRFIGIVELSGAIGILLPTLLRIYPRLTPLAAFGFLTIQVLAIIFHAFRGETATSLPMNLSFAALALFVLWGRTKKLPITARN